MNEKENNKGINFCIRTITPLIVGGEGGVSPSIIDKKMFKLVQIIDKEERIVEKPAIPGSTLKGILRHILEDRIRKLILDKLEINDIAEILANTINVIREFGLIEVLEQNLMAEQQIIDPQLLDSSLSLDSLVSAIKTKAENKGFNISEGLVKLVALNLPSLLPVICDPVSRLHEVPDVLVYDFKEDRNNALRLLLSILLLRKIPFRSEYCPVCTLFGGPGKASPLRFNILVADIEHLPVVTRVSLDRFTETAKKGKLFTTEYVPPGTLFKPLGDKPSIIVIKGLIPPHLIQESEKPNVEEVVKLVKALLRELEVRGIGGMSSTGYGLVKIEYNCRGEEANSSNVDLDEEVKKLLKKHLEFDKKEDFLGKNITELLSQGGLDKNKIEKEVVNAVKENYEIVKKIIT